MFISCNLLKVTSLKRQIITTIGEYVSFKNLHRYLIRFRSFVCIFSPPTENYFDQRHTFKRRRRRECRGKQLVENPLCNEVPGKINHLQLWSSSYRSVQCNRSGRDTYQRLRENVSFNILCIIIILLYLCMNL